MEQNRGHKDQHCSKIDKVALITGSSSGIGANVALDLASLGYNIIITGRNKDNITKIVNKCNELASDSATKSPIAHARQVDLMDWSSIDSLIDFVKTKFNRIDILINNACFRGRKANILTKEAMDDLDQVFRMNVSVPMYLIHKLFISMLPNDSNYKPLVVNISSIASQVVVPLHLYSISKACLSELTKQLADHTDELGLLAITISPGPVLTDERPQHISMSPFTLMNRIGTTQEISNLIIESIKRAPMFNGQELIIDGGYTAKQKQKS